MRDKLGIYVAAFLGLMLVALYATSVDKIQQLESDNRNLEVRLAHAQIPFRTDTIHDSITVVVQQVVEVESRDLKEALAAERQLVSDLKLRLRDLESIGQTSTSISDTVPASYSEPDSLFRYHDQWATMELSLSDSTFRYDVRDSLVTFVSRVTRHRFLWWRWGTKGYEVRHVNFNPHARIVYNRYIKAKE